MDKIKLADKATYEQGVLDARDAIFRNLDEKMSREMKIMQSAKTANEWRQSDRLLAPIRLSVLAQMREEIRTLYDDDDPDDRMTLNDYKRSEGIEEEDADIPTIC